MRVEIHAWQMLGGRRDDNCVDVAYDVYVPIEDCPNSENDSTITIDGKTYKRYAEATWRTELPPGIERYKAWLKHEKAARKRMLALLHEHRPETKNTREWPLLWIEDVPVEAAPPPDETKKIQLTVDHDLSPTVRGETKRPRAA